MAVEGVMTRQDRIRFEMFCNVSRFGSAEADRFPGTSTAGKAFAELDAAIVAIREHALALGPKVKARHSRKAKTRAVLVEWLGTLVRTGREIDRVGPPIGEMFRHAPDQSDAAVLSRAQQILRNIAPVADRFVAFGQPDTFVADFAVAIDAFDHELRRATEDYLARTKARTGTKAAFARAFHALHTLDVVVGNVLKHEDTALIGWKDSRRLVGRRRSAKRAATAADTTTTAITVTRI